MKKEDQKKVDLLSLQLEKITGKKVKLKEGTCGGMNKEQVNENVPNEQTFSTSPNRLLNILSGSEFEIWYKKDFIRYIEGQEGGKTKEQILYDILTLFK